MATDWIGVKVAAGSVLWSAGALFLEGLFWVLLHCILKIAGFMQQGVETFIRVARRPDAVTESWADGCIEAVDDYVSPPIYGYVHHYSHEERVKETKGTVRRPKVKEEADQHRFPGTQHGEGSSNGGFVSHSTKVERARVRLPVGHLADEKCEKYQCNVPDLSGRSDIPHFICNFPGHTNRKWYAVARGRKIGIFKCWEATEEQVKRFSGQSHHSFRSHAEAESWYRFKFVAVE